MRGRLNKLDEQNRGEQPEIGGEISTLSTGIPDDSHFHLGSPDKEKSLLDLMNDLKFPVPNLPNLLEAFVNKFRAPEEGYFKVRKEYKVVEFYLSECNH
jgi:hypothetical protein